MKKICIVTATRAEYGLLKPLIGKVHRADDLDLRLVVTGMHLSSEFGLTYHEIEEDGYPISAKIEMLLSSDTAVGITKSMGVALLGFADYFEAHRPDIVVILGDRYEMLMVASAAMIARIPIAHIHGGEKTEGAVDEAIRHSITKMSHLHFTSTEEYKNRVIQLGENPKSVYNVGALGIESIRTLPLMGKSELETDLGFSFGDCAIMATYHPATLDRLSSREQISNLLDALDRYPEVFVIFTKANADADGRVINQMIEEYASKNNDRCKVFTSLGQLRYLSALQYCAAVVGNSSSGILEAPSMGIPTVDIGDRQKGRTSPESVIHCKNTTESIEDAIALALSEECRTKAREAKNPYEKTDTSGTILQVICASLDRGISLKKEFYDICK